MKFGCCAPVEYAAQVAGLGFDYIELPGKVLHAQGAQEFAATEKALESAEIRCLSLNIYCPPEIVIAGNGYNLEMAAKYARQLAFKANALGVETVGVGSPLSRILPEGYDRVLAWRQAVDFFKATSEEFARYDITVCVEALGKCYCNFINSLKEAFALAQEVNMKHCGIIVDFYNMEHVGEADLDLADYVPLVAHAHISDDDNDPRRRNFLKESKASQHKSRIAGLYQSGYDRKISLEIDVPPDDRLCIRSLEIMRG